MKKQYKHNETSPFNYTQKQYISTLGEVVGRGWSEMKLLYAHSSVPLSRVHLCS